MCIRDRRGTARVARRTWEDSGGTSPGPRRDGRDRAGPPAGTGPGTARDGPGTAPGRARDGAQDSRDARDARDRSRDGAGTAPGPPGRPGRRDCARTPGTSHSPAEVPLRSRADPEPFVRRPGHRLRQQLSVLQAASAAPATRRSGLARATWARRIFQAVLRLRRVGISPHPHSPRTIEAAAAAPGGGAPRRRSASCPRRSWRRSAPTRATSRTSSRVSQAAARRSDARTRAAAGRGGPSRGATCRGATNSNDLRCCASSRAQLARHGPRVDDVVDAVGAVSRAARSGATDRRPSLAAPALSLIHI